MLVIFSSPVSNKHALIYRDIFSTINHVNIHYEGTSSSTNTQAELLQMWLDAPNIYYKMVDDKPLVLLGNMKKYQGN